MGYFLAFGLVFVGYSLVDWGHYVLKHESVSLWWLMTGQGTKEGGGTPKPSKGATLGTPGNEVPGQAGNKQRPPIKSS